MSLLRCMTAIVLELRECYKVGKVYKGGSMYRLLRDNVYLTKESIIYSLAMHGPRVCVCVYREDH